MLPKILLGVGLFATLFSVLIFSGKLPIGKKKNDPRGDVIMWGTLPEQAMTTLMQEYNPKAKTYAVRYRYIPEVDFEQRLLEALASGQNPDMIVAPQQIILSQMDRIYPFAIAEKNYRDTFVNGASIFLTSRGALALPISIEPMVLFYNRTLFSKHGIVNPPVYWDEVATLAPALTLKQGAQFVESGVALGTANIPYAKDIIMAIVTQLGQSPVLQATNPDGSTYFSVQANEPIAPPVINATALSGEKVILPLATVNRFYTQFGDTGQTAYSWSQAQTASPADFFVGEKLAMYIGYSGEYQSLRARNLRGDFQMTTLPQARGYTTFSTGMRMYGVATLNKSRNLLASQTVQVDFSSIGVSLALANMIGAVPALRSYTTTPTLDPVIARSMLVARGWYDKYPKESTALTATMISDIINYRYGVNDATTLFIGRLRDLYAKSY